MFFDVDLLAASGPPVETDLIARHAAPLRNSGVIAYDQPTDANLILRPFGLTFTETAADQTIRVALVNTMSEVPPMAHYPRRDRSRSSWLETGAYVQKSWSDARLTRRIVSPDELHLFTDGGSQISTFDGSSPSGWRLTFYSPAVDNDEVDYTIRSGSVQLAKVRPFHGFYESGAPEPDANEGTGAISADVGLDKRHVVAYLDANGEVAIRIEDHVLSLIELVETGIAADDLEIRIHKYKVPNEVRLYTVESNVAFRRISRNGGRTFGAPVSLGTAMNVTACIGFGGTEFVYRIDGSGPYDIVGRRYDPNGTALEAEFVAVSGVDNAGLAATVAPIRRTGNRVVLRYLLGGALTSKSSRDGITFI